MLKYVRNFFQGKNALIFCLEKNGLDFLGYLLGK